MNGPPFYIYLHLIYLHSVMPLALMIYKHDDDPDVFPGEARPDAGGRDGAAGLCRQHDGECLPRLRLPHQDLRHGLDLCPH